MRHYLATVTMTFDGYFKYIKCTNRDIFTYFVVMNINTVFAAVFLWILVNIVQSCAAFVCTDRLKRILVFLFIDFLRKVKNFKSMDQSC